MLNNIYISDELWISQRKSFVLSDLIEKYFGSDMVNINGAKNNTDAFLEELRKLGEPLVYDYIVKMLYPSK